MKTQEAVEREIGSLRTFKHPMVMDIVDIVKDKNDFLCIIMEKCNQSLAKIIQDS